MSCNRRSAELVNSAKIRPWQRQADKLGPRNFLTKARRCSLYRGDYRAWRHPYSATHSSIRPECKRDSIGQLGTRLTNERRAPVLDHSHMALFGPDPQTVPIKAGEIVYFQYVRAPSFVFEVADDQKQAAKTVSEMRSVEEALPHSKAESGM
jgi:hypothetical protein